MKMIMSKTDDCKQILTQYIREALDMDVQLKPIDKRQSNGLPLAVLGSFCFLEAEMLQNRVVFAMAEDGNALSPAVVKRMLEIAQRQLGKIVVFVTCHIAAYNAQRLVSQRVNLIIPGKRMFLPGLLVDLRRDFTPNKDLTTTVPPLGQVIVLYHIEVAAMEGKSAHDVMRLFNVSYATANRAIRWLCTHGLCALSVNKRTKGLHFDLSKRDLWEAAKPMLTSPVEKTIYTDERLTGGLACGINALSEYSMLSGEPRQWLALTREQLARSSVKTDEHFGSNVIEVWRYDPTWLTTTTIVDRLSLYLALESHDDERVQMELEHMMNAVEW